MQAENGKEAVISKKLKDNVEDNLNKYENLIDYLLPFIVVVSLLLIKFAFAFHMDSDPLWSIAVGEWIHTNRTVPLVDHFSWTVSGEKWYSNSWLFCWLIYLADQSMGYLGIALIILVPCLVTGYYLYWTCMKYNNSLFSILCFLTGTALLFLIFITPRAYIFTFTFIVMIFYLIRFKRDTNYIYLIPIIMLLWSNIQNSMFFGIGILLIEAIVGTVFFKDKRLWTIVLLSVLATFINPYGIDFWTVSLSVPFDTSNQYIAEWKAPDFNEWGLIIIYFFSFLVGMLGASRLKDDIKNHIIDRDKIMILFWFWITLFYAFTALRAASYVLLFIGPCFAAFATKEEKPQYQKKIIALALCSILCIAIMAISLPKLLLPINQDSGKPTSFVNYITENPMIYEKVGHVIPVGAVEYLKSSLGESNRLLNSYISGGYLIMNNIEVFIDARFTVYARNSVAKDYYEMVTLKRDPDLLIEQYGIDYILISIDEPIAFYFNLHPEWEKKYEDDLSIIFFRAGQK